MCHPCAGLIYFRAKTCFMMTPRCGERGANSVGEGEGGARQLPREVLPPAV